MSPLLSNGQKSLPECARSIWEQRRKKKASARKRRATHNIRSAEMRVSDSRQKCRSLVPSIAAPVLVRTTAISGVKPSGNGPTGCPSSSIFFFPRTHARIFLILGRLRGRRRKSHSFCLSLSLPIIQSRRDRAKNGNISGPAAHDFSMSIIPCATL